jgi:hypothetical protein
MRQEMIGREFITHLARYREVTSRWMYGYAVAGSSDNSWELPVSSVLARLQCQARANLRQFDSDR